MAQISIDQRLSNLYIPIRTLLCRTIVTTTNGILHIQFISFNHLISTNIEFNRYYVDAYINKTKKQSYLKRINS